MTGMGSLPSEWMLQGIPLGRNLISQTNPGVNRCKYDVKYVTIVLHFENSLAH